MRQIQRWAAGMIVALAVAGSAAARGEERFEGRRFAADVDRVLAAEARGEWKRVPWRRDVAAAVREARREGKPLAVFLLRADGLNPDVACLGARATRGTAHSDPLVIRMLSQRFVPLAIDVTDDQFPAALPGLAPAKAAYNAAPLSHLGFSMTGVLTPDGRYPLAFSGDSSVRNYRRSVAYDPVKYLRMLAEGEARAARAAGLDPGDSGARAFATETLRALATTDARHDRLDAALTVADVAERGRAVTMRDGAVYRVGEGDARRAAGWGAGTRLWAEPTAPGADFLDLVGALDDPAAPLTVRLRPAEGGGSGWVTAERVAWSGG